MKSVGVLCTWCALSSASMAQDLQAEVNAAIERGVNHLLKFELPGTKLDIPGASKNEQYYGAQALIGWTLLESGVPANHPKVVSIAEEVRKASTFLKYSYSISFSVIFLDKLGNPADSLLIKSLGVRLLAGQNKFGGWSYHCPYPNQREQQRLADYIAQVKDKKIVEPASPEKKTEKAKYLEVSEMLRNYLAAPSFGDPSGAGDNSNTQVAMMALWVARRHGIPATWALTEVEKRFRQTQLKSGNWPYIVQFGAAAPPLPGKPPVPGNPPLPAPPPVPGGGNPEPKLPSMACAGLLGLALGQGVREKERDLKDPVVKAALIPIEKFLDEDLTRTHSLDINHYYCLFSLERMALVYDLEMINKKDWYGIGATNLVKLQAKDGRWAGHYDEWGADTCFALLFLKKANVAKDLKKIITEPGPRKSNKKEKDDDLPLPLPLPKKEKSKDPPERKSKDPERKSSSPKQSSLNLDPLSLDPRLAHLASPRVSPASKPRLFVQPSLFRRM